MNLKEPSVLIVILNYGTYDLTINMVQELHTKLDYNNYEIMVIDNCSPNESAKVLEEASARMHYIFYANSRNAGYAAGNNIGIRYGIKNGFKYSWILNNDVDLREKNVLSEMVRLAESEEFIGCVGPKIYNFDESICPPYCLRPTLWSMTLGIFHDKRYRRKNIEVLREVYRVYGCCMLLKNKAMEDADCFDERTFLYGEEMILAEKLIAKGYKTYYLPRVSVLHKGSLTMKRMTKGRKKFQIEQSEKSHEIYLKDYRRFSLVSRKICHLTRRIIRTFR